MARKVVLVTDPGIDGAFAVALALHDPALEVLGLAATAGNVGPEQATRNVHTLLALFDPPRWPRLGTAPPVEYEVDDTKLHGPGGLGGLTFPCAEPHHTHPSDKVLVDLVHQYPKEVTIVVMGPLTVLARALGRDPELPQEVERVVVVGGAWREPGNATAVAEFHVYCDPEAARQVLRSGLPITLVPLDVTRKMLYSPSALLNLPAPDARTCQFLRQIVPFGIAANSNLCGIEGFYLKDVLGVVAASQPGLLSTRPMSVDVETRGELTRGMTVVDARTGSRPGQPNVELATDVELQAVREYIDQTLRRTQ